MPKLISKKAPFPPLGLVTVAAMFPDSWEKKLVDMNITTLTDRDLRWADYVFISEMDVQRKSVNEVIARCQKLGASLCQPVTRLNLSRLPLSRSRPITSPRLPFDLRNWRQ